MALSSLLKVKNLLNTKRNSNLNGSGGTDPEIGMKLAYNSVSRCLYVTLLGARHLPSFFGLSQAKGYVVKVKVFPGSTKFESEIQESSWPVWNQEFKFQLGPPKKTSTKTTQTNNMSADLAGHFISLTVYAVLELVPSKEEESAKKKELKSSMKNTTQAAQPEQPETQSSSKISKFQRILSDTFKTEEKQRPSKLTSKRRTIGVATWNFEAKQFSIDLKYDVLGTPDIWRPLTQITTGVEEDTNASKKGEVEASLVYVTSENKCNDYISITIAKMRCNVKTMQEHEMHKEPLYLKASISDKENEAHWKSERFFPTISARWDTKTATTKLHVNAATLPNVTIYISLGCKNNMGVKENLGRITISPNGDNTEFWSKAIKSPGVPVSQWLTLV